MPDLNLRLAERSSIKKLSKRRPKTPLKIEQPELIDL